VYVRVSESSQVCGTGVTGDAKSLATIKPRAKIKLLIRRRNMDIGFKGSNTASKLLKRQAHAVFLSMNT
jgi:hypothetical protein